MSLIILKIVVNTTGFLISYISVDNGYYIPGILIGIGLLFASIIIPEKLRWLNTVRTFQRAILKKRRIASL